MKNRLLFLFLFLILVTAFIITGAYYLLVLIIIFITLILLSLFSMLIFSKKFEIKLIEKLNKTYFVYQSNIFPIGKLSVNLNIKNIFHEEYYTNHFELLLGESHIEMKLPLDKTKLGKYVVDKQTFILSDFLGLFKKRIDKEVFSEMIQYPNLDYSAHDHKVNDEVTAYQANKSDDYDIREYRIGDSLKDIHYKMSYKLSTYMIKERHKNRGNHISVYLDLSGNNEECERVFVYLNQLIQSLQVYNEVCLVKWISNKEIYEQKVSDMNDLKNCMTQILSMPKCKEIPNIKATWLLTPNGLK